MSEARLRNPKWSKRDYEAVAETIRAERRDSNTSEYPFVVNNTAERIARRFVTVFKADSPYLFNEKKFLTMCGVQE